MFMEKEESPKDRAKRVRWVRGIIKKSQREIQLANDRLLKASALIGDMDQYFVSMIEGRITDLEQLSKDIKDHTEQRLAAGEHVGPYL